jgi:hypothetical protein
VSLFDFDTASEAEFETHRHDYWRGDVFIRIRRDALDPTMLNRAEDMWTDPRLDTLSDEDKHKLVRIPYLEVLPLARFSKPLLRVLSLLQTKAAIIVGTKRHRMPLACEPAVADIDEAVAGGDRSARGINASIPINKASPPAGSRIFAMSL